MNFFRFGGREVRQIAPMKKIGAYYSFFLIFALFLLTGCEVIVPLVGAGAGVGVPYYVTDSADRTFNYPLQKVEGATPQVLEKMGIEMAGVSELENGKRISGLTRELEIEIEMQRVTETATRVTVNARKNTVFKDKATSEEIINQLQKSLSDTTQTAKTPAPAQASAATLELAPVATQAPVPVATPMPAPAGTPTTLAPATTLKAATPAQHPTATPAPAQSATPNSSSFGTPTPFSRIESPTSAPDN